MPFYAVANGYESGVYQTWADCEKQVKGYKGASFKKFKSRSEAERFVSEYIPKTETMKGAIPKIGISASLSAVVGPLRANKPRVQIEEQVSAHLPGGKKEPFECLDYIPFDGNHSQRELKKENMDTSLWFEDTEGDKELILALSALVEYPDDHTEGSIAVATCKAPPKCIKIGKHNFTLDNDGFVDAYISGNSENVGLWNCMAGYGVYYGVHHGLNVAKPATGKMTRNVGEIEAAIHAINTGLKIGITKLCLHTDSEFLLKVATSWIYFWKRNGWRTKDGKVVQNRKELEKLEALLADEKISIKWHDVNGCCREEKILLEANKLAELGTEEYLDLHPNKDEDSYCDLDNFGHFDYSFF